MTTRPATTRPTFAHYADAITHGTKQYGDRMTLLCRFDVWQRGSAYLVTYYADPIPFNAKPVSRHYKSGRGEWLSEPVPKNPARAKDTESEG